MVCINALLDKYTPMQATSDSLFGLYSTPHTLSWVQHVHVTQHYMAEGPALLCDLPQRPHLRADGLVKRFEGPALRPATSRQQRLAMPAVQRCVPKGCHGRMRCL